MIPGGRGLTHSQLMGLPTPQGWQTGASPLVIPTMPLPQDAQNVYQNTNYTTPNAFQDADNGYVDVANTSATTSIPTSPSHSLLGIWAPPPFEAPPTMSPRGQLASPLGGQALASPLLFTGMQFFSPQRGSPLIQRDDWLGLDTALLSPEVALPNTLGLHNVHLTMSPRGLPVDEETVPPPAPLMGTVPLPQDVVQHPPNVTFRRVYHRSFGRNEH